LPQLRIREYTIMELMEIKDDLQYSTLSVTSLINKLKPPKNEGKISPFPAHSKFEHQCGWVRKFIEDELEIPLQISDNCVIPFDKIFGLWIERE
jgi:hypothetical protein